MIVLSLKTYKTKERRYGLGKKIWNDCLSEEVGGRLPALRLCESQCHLPHRLNNVTRFSGWVGHGLTMGQGAVPVQYEGLEK